MRLRWKREPRETGLRSVMARPRGYNLHDGENTYAAISYLGRYEGDGSGWYWVASWDFKGPYKNTCNEPPLSLKEAKKQAAAYVKQFSQKDKK